MTGRHITSFSFRGSTLHRIVDDAHTIPEGELASLIARLPTPTRQELAAAKRPTGRLLRPTLRIESRLDRFEEIGIYDEILEAALSHLGYPSFDGDPVYAAHEAAANYFAHHPAATVTLDSWFLDGRRPRLVTAVHSPGAVWNPAEVPDWCLNPDEQHLFEEHGRGLLYLARFSDAVAYTASGDTTYLVHLLPVPHRQEHPLRRREDAA